MSNNNYIIEILNLKEKNLFFNENFYYEEKVNGVTHKFFEAFLSYIPTHCYKCGVLFDNQFEKHGFVTSNIKIPDVSGFKSILKLHKQRYLCKHCNKAFTLSTNIIFLLFDIIFTAIMICILIPFIHIIYYERKIY